MFRNRGLKKENFSFEVNYLIDAFLVERAITLLYAPPKIGKSRFTLGLSKKLTHAYPEKIIQYFDYDNSLAALVDRKLEEVIEGETQLDYIHPEITAMSAQEVIKSLTDGVTPDAHDLYAEYIFVFDSVQDFIGDVRNDQLAKRFMNAMKKLRNAGATIILLHHANKNEKMYQGSLAFKSMSDNVYRLTKGTGSEGKDAFLLEVEAPRFKIEDVAFLIDSKYALEQREYSELCLTPKEVLFIEQVKAVLLNEPEGISQSKLLKEMGYAKSNNAIIPMLQKFTNTIWITEEGARGAKQYKIK